MLVAQWGGGAAAEWRGIAVGSSLNLDVVDFNAPHRDVPVRPADHLDVWVERQTRSIDCLEFVKVALLMQRIEG